MLVSRCWREVLIRAGMTVIIVGVLCIWQRVSPWVWLAPPAIAGLIILRWAMHPPQEEDQAAPYDSESPPDSRSASGGSSAAAAAPSSQPSAK